MVRHSMTAQSCTDVMRCMGQRVRLDGSGPERFSGEVVMDRKKREEGVQIKHRVNSNSLKAYDKAWRPIRKGSAGLHRRPEVSGRAVDRYMDALAQVDEKSTVQEPVDQLNERKQGNGQSIRGLQPFGKDDALLLAVNRGDFLLQGARNRDLQKLLFDKAPGTEKEKRQPGTPRAPN